MPDFVRFPDPEMIPVISAREPVSPAFAEIVRLPVPSEKSFVHVTTLFETEELKMSVDVPGKNDVVVPQTGVPVNPVMASGPP